MTSSSTLHVRIPRPTTRSCAALRILCIDALEVLQNSAPFVGAQSAQLFPRRLAELRARAAGGVRIVRLEFVPALRRRRLALVRVLAFVFLQRVAGVEQATEELLLARDRGGVETAAL